MENSNKTQVVKDFNEKSVLVSREFSAPIALVWRAYTESELLDQWWAPEPWRAETKRMDFVVGGHWLYAMVGTDNSKHWGIMNYKAIDPMHSIGIEDAFCDEDGNINISFPISKGSTNFTVTPTGTKVEFKMQYPTEADLQAIIEMGFEQGITACLDQLEQLFQTNKIA